MFKQTLTSAAVAMSASALLLGGCMSMDGMNGDSTAGDAMGASVVVGGAAMYPTRNIVENAVNSRDHTTLVAARSRVRLST